jgi:hypothetical protein
MGRSVGAPNRAFHKPMIRCGDASPKWAEGANPSLLEGVMAQTAWNGRRGGGAAARLPGEQSK